MSAKPDFVAYDASNNLCQVEELKDYLTFFESIRWKLVLDSISHESLQVGKRNRTSFAEDFQAFVYNDLFKHADEMDSGRSEICAQASLCTSCVVPF